MSKLLILLSFIILNLYTSSVRAADCKKSNPYTNPDYSIGKQTAYALNNIILGQKENCGGTIQAGEMVVPLVEGKLTVKNLSLATAKILGKRDCGHNVSFPTCYSASNPSVECTGQMINHFFLQKYSASSDYYKLYHIDLEKLEDAGNYGAQLEILKQGIQGLLRTETAIPKNCIQNFCTYCSERGINCSECAQGSNDVTPYLKLLQDPNQIMLDPAGECRT